jgi:uracil-DNA glycosylase
MCYVTNVLPWRPPGNRTPYPFQVRASEERLAAEIALVDPVIVVAAGAVAWRGVTREKAGRFDEARFAWHELDGRRLLCIPHPAALLRLKGAEREDWERATRAALAEALPKKASA